MFRSKILIWIQFYLSLSLGKTCILFRFSENNFNTTFISTIGKHKTQNFEKISIWLDDVYKNRYSLYRSKWKEKKRDACVVEIITSLYFECAFKIILRALWSTTGIVFPLKIATSRVFPLIDNVSFNCD